MTTEPVGPVIVGVDGTLTSLEAVDLAAEEALARVTPLLVLYAHGGAPRLPDSRMLGARRLLEVAAARARSEHPGLSVATDLVSAHPVDALLRYSGSASLVVVGHAGGVQDGRSVAARVAAGAGRPVLVYRPLAAEVPEPMSRPVLVGLAGAVGADPLLGFAFAEAALRGAPLLALHAWSEPADRYSIGVGLDGYHGRLAREGAGRLLSESLSVWADKYPEVTVRQAVRHCLDVGVALTAASRSAQLVVVGQPRTVAGSVFSVLLHRAGCPVVVVPAG
jgi:nucleotide-binding universal stress UspA family protein